MQGLDRSGQVVQMIIGIIKGVFLFLIILGVCMAALLLVSTLSSRNREETTTF